MRVTRAYIDTSVIGGYYDDEFSDESKRLFELFREGKMIAIVSEVTLIELQKAPENVQQLLEQLPEKSLEMAETNQ